MLSQDSYIEAQNEKKELKDKLIEFLKYDLHICIKLLEILVKTYFPCSISDLE